MRTGDEDAGVLADAQLASDELNLGVGVGDSCAESELDALDLLRDRTEDTLFESVEFVEASPGADLAEPDEDPTHRLEVECLVAAEDEDEAAELHAESLDGFGLPWGRKREMVSRGQTQK